MPTKARRLALKPNSICPVCQTPFYASRAQREASSDGIVYCSQKCVRSAKRIGGRKNLQVSMICQNCGNEFLVKHHRVVDESNPQFCSQKCHGEFLKREGYERNKRFCAWCGEPYSRPPSAYGNYCSSTCAYWAGIDKHHLAGPNGLETDFLNCFPQLTYVGDGNFWLRDELGHMNPDFILRGTNKLVELWGNFWHEGQNPEDRIERLRKLGFDCLVVWESDFRDHFDSVKELVEDFLR